ncbi:MAG: hypothetical protein U9N31_06970 [Candidatus Marinimicrobia bacterium]|nr:hypothetical protein [Candidatus Neomarinimicrobiota bacterium]
MNKKQRLVAKKHRKNKERMKALKQASIASGVKKAEKLAPMTEAKAPVKAAAAAKKTAEKKATAKKTTAKKTPAKASTKKSTAKASPAVKKTKAKTATAAKKKPAAKKSDA